jgi:DNA-binding transcriptional LysR family regulator
MRSCGEPYAPLCLPCLGLPRFRPRATFGRRPWCASTAWPGLASQIPHGDNLLRREADIAVRMVEPAHEALVVRRIGTVALGLHAHRSYLDRTGRPRTFHSLRNHTLIGFDRETPEIRSMRQRIQGLAAVHFAFRTDSDIAQLMAIRAGLGIGICQVALARRDPNFERVLPGLQLKLGVWLAMHENLRSTPRCRAVFDGLVAGLMSHVD